MSFFFAFLLLPAILSAYLASGRGRHVWLWFLLGFFFSYLALIILLLLPPPGSRSFYRGKNQTGPEMNWGRKTERRCPYCGANVIFDDIPGNWTCPHCGRTFIYSADGGIYRMRNDRLLPQIELIVKLFAKLAKHDGRVTESEIRQVDQLVRQFFQPSREQLHQIMDIFNEARYSAESFDDIAGNLYFSVGGRADVLQETLAALLAIGYADGELRPEEESMIRRAAQIFRMETLYESLKRQFNRQSGTTEARPTLDVSYQLLGCTPQDSLDIIRKKYRQQIKNNHPDRLISRGASDAEVKAANKKIAAIKKAYEQILAARG